jgi:5-methylcytosine-specific restriction endonuclease McrA
MELVCSTEWCNLPPQVTGMCKKHYDQNRYVKQRDKLLAQSKAYAAAHKEAVNAKTKAWDEANPGKKAIRTRNSYLRNMEKRKKYHAEWRKNNRLRWNYYASLRRIRVKENGVFKILDKEFKALGQKPCFYCGSTDSLTLDHVIPIARGGKHSIGNLVVACKPCNSQKNKRTIQEWRQLKLRLLYTQ